MRTPAILADDGAHTISAPKREVRAGAVVALPLVRAARARPGSPVLDDRAVAPRVRVVPGQWITLLGVAVSADSDTQLHGATFLARTAREGGTTARDRSRAHVARWRVPQRVARADRDRASGGGTAMVPGVDPRSFPRRARRLCRDARWLPLASFGPRAPAIAAIKRVGVLARQAIGPPRPGSHGGESPTVPQWWKAALRPLRWSAWVNGVVSIAQEIADNFWPDELTDPWPLCPAHRDPPLHPSVTRGAPHGHAFMTRRWRSRSGRWDSAELPAPGG